MLLTGLACGRGREGVELQEVNLAWAHPSQFFTSKGNKQHTSVNNPFLLLWWFGWEWPLTGSYICILGSQLVSCWDRWAGVRPCRRSIAEGELRFQKPRTHLVSMTWGMTDSGRARLLLCLLCYLGPPWIEWVMSTSICKGSHCSVYWLNANLQKQPQR